MYQSVPARSGCAEMKYKKIMLLESPDFVRKDWMEPDNTAVFRRGEPALVRRMWFTKRKVAGELFDMVLPSFR
jgi:hypothetical protein